MVTKPRLLIVEDDLDLLEMINSYFEVQNYDVETTAWGSEALKLAEEKTFDLAMLDIRLPDIDGFELCRRLREQRKTKEMPILFLTERRDRVDKLQGLELGVVDYITKPFDLQELGLRIRNALARAATPAVTNRATDLPEGKIVDEKLASLFNSPQGWTVVAFSITEFARFREDYGFMAADDAMRALALMVRSAVREYGKDEDFTGHIGTAELVIVTQAERAPILYERIVARIQQSRTFFTPAHDTTLQPLRMSAAIYQPADELPTTLLTLKSAIRKALKPVT